MLESVGSRVQSHAVASRVSISVIFNRATTGEKKLLVDIVRSLIIGSGYFDEFHIHITQLPIMSYGHVIRTNMSSRLSGTLNRLRWWNTNMTGFRWFSQIFARSVDIPAYGVTYPSGVFLWEQNAVM